HCEFLLVRDFISHYDGARGLVPTGEGRGLLRPFFPISGADDGLDVAAHVEIALDVKFQRVAGRDEIFENSVDHVLMEDLHLAERIDVKLQRLQFYAAAVRHVADAQRGEVREVRERADRRELRRGEFDLDAIAHVLIFECVERVEVHLLDRRRTNFKLCLRSHFTQRRKSFARSGAGRPNNPRPDLLRSQFIPPSTSFLPVLKALDSLGETARPALFRTGIRGSTKPSALPDPPPLKNHRQKSWTEDQTEPELLTWTTR